jgi:hypothetical protein
LRWLGFSPDTYEFPIVAKRASERAAEAALFAGAIEQCGGPSWTFCGDPRGHSYIGPVIRITITAEAFNAVAATLALGMVAVEPERVRDGCVHIWLDPGVAAKLKALRGPGESYSDVILRVAKGEGGNLTTTH